MLELPFVEERASLGSGRRAIYQEMGVSAAKDVEEADRSVEQGVDREQSALADAVALARMPQMLDHGFVADPEDPRDLPVRFSSRGPHHAFALAVGQAAPGSRRSAAAACAAPLRTQRRRQAEAAGDARSRSWSPAAEAKEQEPWASPGTWAGTVKPSPIPCVAGELEDLRSRGVSAIMSGSFGPGEADAGQVARAVDRIGRAKLLLVEPFGPAGGIIVEPDDALLTCARRHGG